MNKILLDGAYSFIPPVPDFQQIERKVDQMENIKRGNILMSHHTIMQEVNFFFLSRLRGKQIK
jgi:hypothetical protein